MPLVPPMTWYHKLLPLASKRATRREPLPDSTILLVPSQLVPVIPASRYTPFPGASATPSPKLELEAWLLVRPTAQMALPLGACLTRPAPVDPAIVRTFSTLPLVKTS